MDNAPDNTKKQRFEEGAMEALSLLAVAWGREIRDNINCTRDEAVKLTAQVTGQQAARLFDDSATVYDT